ncbi:MAG: hypothetical protein QGI83_12375 [Candidatus Latescibacteria bacterium]|jgi:hypothetical protein|nr:hypothetical protein [Candidatus Latescibacterota bacterium]
MQPTGGRSERRDASPDRRAGADRRQSQQPIDFADRREASDRRQLARRKKDQWDGVKVFEWETERPGFDLEKLKRILLIAVPAVLLAGAVVCLCVLDPEVTPPTKKPKRAGPIRAPVVKRPTAPKAAQTTAKDDAAVSNLSQDVLNVAPRIYYFVRLELDSGEYIDRKKGSGQDLAFVRTIEISTRAKPWDNLSSSDKVDLLHRTYNLLKKKYPHATRLTKLVFDDGRKDLELRFGATTPSNR